jgi:transcription elongation factor Elf1
MTDILNCPCCEGKARFVDTVKVVKKLVRIGRIECKVCGLRTGVNTFGRVCKVWNRRPVKAAVQA